MGGGGKYHGKAIPRVGYPGGDTYRPPPTQVVATAAVSMYPTGMLSCIIAMFWCESSKNSLVSLKLDSLDQTF